jgi:hypothetical protein
MDIYFYQFLQLLTLAALPIYAIGIIYCAAAGADSELGWFNSLFIAIFFTPFIALICIFASRSKTEMKEQNRIIQQNESIIKLLAEREGAELPS